MKLAQKLCEACNKNTPRLTESKILDLFTLLSGWNISQDGKWLEKSYKFRNFADALAFVGQVAEVAEAENHHPDIAFGWGYANLRLQTHAIDGLHGNDFIIAAKIDEISAL